MSSGPQSRKPLKLFLAAGEASGDQLGAALMNAMRARAPEIAFAGIGGEAMALAGLKSLFPLSDISVMGLGPVMRRLPLLIRRIRETAAACIAAEPDALIIIDSPDFTHRVAKRVRRAAPGIAIINYVSPSVWAWRPGRAKKMRAYVDHLLTLLPFEPEAHQRLGGPPAEYTGHPLIERTGELRPGPGGETGRGLEAPVLLILPGSRGAEIRRLMPPFGEAAALVARGFPSARFLLPAVSHMLPAIREHLKSWSVQPEIVEGEAAKYAAFRQARAALAASGTVTLELALAGVPSVVAYRVNPLEAAIARRLIKVPSVVLPNLILGQNAYPEYLQEACAGPELAAAWQSVIADSPARARQLELLARLDAAMAIPGGSPSAAAAEAVLRALQSAKPPLHG